MEICNCKCKGGRFANCDVIFEGGLITCDEMWQGGWEGVDFCPKLCDVIDGRPLSLFFTQRRQTATKSLPTFKLDIAVRWVVHAFQTCHVITSNKCVQLLTKQLQNCFCLMRQNRWCLSNIAYTLKVHVLL